MIRAVVKDNRLILAVFVLALFLRTYQLPSIPAGIHGDEASVGYNAYSLLKTLRDQDGNFLPLVIDQWGDFRPAGQHYLDVPFIAILGLNELSTRLPSALSGAITIIVFYFFVLKLFDNKKLALTASTLLAVSPWHINISRATSEGVIAAFFIIFASYLLLKGMGGVNQTKVLLLSFLSFFASFFFYHSARFFTPVVSLSLIIISSLKQQITRKTLICCLSLYAILLLALLLVFIRNQGTNRPFNISIFNIPGGSGELKHSQDTDGTQNPLLTRFFHNKLFFYGRLFATSYFQHFNGDFLLVHNGFPIRYRIPWTGNIYSVEFPFLIFGFAILLVNGIKFKKYSCLVPILWLLVAAIPAGLTWEDIPNVQRSSFMIYGIVIISAFGFIELLDIASKKQRIVLSGIVFLILSQNFISFLHMYFYHSRIEEPWYRSAAVKEIVLTLGNLSKNYDRVIMTTQGNNNLIHQLYYSRFNPSTFQKIGSPKESDGLHFQNLILTTDSCPLKDSLQENPNITERKILYINKSECQLPKTANVIQTIRHPDGIPAYIVAEN